MHDIRWIRDNADAFDAALKRRGLTGESQRVISIDDRRRAIIRVLEDAQARRNAASKEIGTAKRNKDELAAQTLMATVAGLRDDIVTMEREEKEVSQELEDALAWIPNLPLPAPQVPDGKDEHDNIEHHHFGSKKVHGFSPKAHDDLGENLGDMDFAVAAKLSGARFVVLKKGLARLERALGQFMLDVHTQEHGYSEVNPPLLVKSDAMFGTTQLPKFREDQFRSSKPMSDEDRILEANERIHARFIPADKRTKMSWDEQRHYLEKNVGLPVILDTIGKELAGVPFEETYWLIPTAEVSLTNLVRESILDEKELPLRFSALTPCFRAEAGAAGRDTRGMIRQHQFNKVELVSITTPETSRDEHERMLSCAEEILRRLDLHYRVVTLCAGDMGFASQKTYDIEVWMPGQGEGGMYREISSCSVCGDFQARRMNARYRGPDNKPRFVHTLNGSGTAVGRALIAVMETYQQQGGSIAVPDVLQPYMGGRKTIEKGE